MKFTVPGVVITALLMVPAAFAQYGNPTDTSTSAASATKDGTWSVNTRVKNHVERYKQRKANHGQQRHHAKAKAQTTGTGTSLAPGSSTNKDDTAPKSQ